MPTPANPLPPPSSRHPPIPLYPRPLKCHLPRHPGKSPNLPGTASLHTDLLTQMQPQICLPVEIFFIILVWLLLWLGSGA